MDFLVASSRRYSYDILDNQCLEELGSLEPSTARHRPNQVACTCDYSI